MGTDDYRRAVAAAREDGVVLPSDEGTVGPTLWDPRLADLFKATRAVVHQERLLDSLLESAST